jgi:hypothetical protein
MTNVPNNSEVSETAKNYKTTAEAIDKTTYWFHDIKVDYQARQFMIAREINPYVKVIAILIMLIIFHRTCPGLLQSVINILPSVIKASQPQRDNMIPLEKRNF